MTDLDKKLLLGVLQNVPRLHRDDKHNLRLADESFLNRRDMSSIFAE